MFVTLSVIGEHCVKSLITLLYTGSVPEKQEASGQKLNPQDQLHDQTNIY